MSSTPVSTILSERELDKSPGTLILETCKQYIDSQPTQALQTTDPVTHFILVRKDIPRGLQLAQVTHAAGESSPGNLKAGTFAVVLAVQDEDELRFYAKKLEAYNVPHQVIIENSKDYRGQAMAIGVVPDLRSRLKRHFSSLPLAG